MKMNSEEREGKEREKVEQSFQAGRSASSAQFNCGRQMAMDQVMDGLNCGCLFVCLPVCLCQPTNYKALRQHLILINASLRIMPQSEGKESDRERSQYLLDLTVSVSLALCLRCTTKSGRRSAKIWQRW